MVADKTIPKMFLKKTTRALHKKSVGWIEGNELNFYSNEDYLQKVKTLFYAFNKLGIFTQDKVAILGNTSKEWHFFDLAAMCARGVVIPIYPTYLEHEVEYILNHSEAKYLILENESQMKKIIDTQKNLPHLKFIIALKEISDESKAELSKEIVFYTLDEFVQLGVTESEVSPKLFDDTVESSDPNDTASIIYTSGTTGDPKGAVILQKPMFTLL